MGRIILIGFSEDKFGKARKAYPITTNRLEAYATLAGYGTWL
jgi:hypothetical protein